MVKDIRTALIGMLVLTAASAVQAQSSRGPVQLEAADCSRMRATFGDQQVANAVQHASVPFSTAILDVRPGGNGGVRIERGAGDHYSITACIAAGAATREDAQRAADAVRLSIEGNRVRVADGGLVRNWSVHLIVEAPPGAQLDVETANGPISFHGVEGSFTARASNGPISLDEVAASVRAVAVNGPISVSGSRGNLDLQTQNGPISVQLQGNRWEGEMQARAQNGPLTIGVPDDFQSGLEVSSSGSSPWNCRIAACSDGTRTAEDRSRTLRLGTGPVVIKLSTVNGPVSLNRAR